MKKSLNEVLSGLGGPNAFEKVVLDSLNKNSQHFFKATVKNIFSSLAAGERDATSDCTNTRQYNPVPVSSADLRQGCALFRDFETGTGVFCAASDEAKSEILPSIAMSLRNVPGGEDYFLKRVKEDSIFDYPNMEWPWEHQFDYFRKNGYWPPKCEKFCPKASTCNHASDMLKTAYMVARDCNKRFQH